jgi:hypothetical protein
MRSNSASDHDGSAPPRAWRLGITRRPGRWITKLSSCIGLATLFFAFQTSARAAVSMWPLLEVSNDGTTVLYPFYVHEGNFLMIFPFFYRTNEGKDCHFVWPIAKTSEGRLSRLMPFWYSADKGTFTFFPLMRQTPDYVAWTIPPVYHRTDGKFMAIFPFFARFENGFFVFPSIYRSKTPERDFWMLFPLFSRNVEDNFRSLWIAPYYNRQSEASSYWALHPLIALERSKPGRDPFFKLDLLGPIYTQEVSASSFSLLILPFLYRSRSDFESSFVLFPVFAHDWEKNTAGDESKTLWIIPYLQERSPSRSYTALYPIFGYEKQKQEADQATTFWLLGPLYRRSVLRSSSGEALEYQRRFLIFSDVKERSGRRVFKLLGIPIVERTS